jgi:hypothetical protein
MFAALAALCFLAELLHLHLGSVDLTVLGLFFVSLALVFSGAPILPWKHG